jgi:DNA-directed RNA polymerase subunit RPC12/RpoP
MQAVASGSILWLWCSACGAEFPTFEFFGENDYETAGLRTKTDSQNKLLYVYNLCDDAPLGDDVQFVRAEHLQPQPGESFQEYHERNKKHESRYFYKCLYCGGDYAEQISQLSITELESKGYKFVDLVR